MGRRICCVPAGELATREEWPKAILGINERKHHRHSEHTDGRTELTQSGVLEPRRRVLNQHMASTKSFQVNPS